MASLDNLGYSTYVLGTIRAVTECERILVYNKNSFIGNPNYSRINLYNLEDIFERVLYLGNGEYNSRCLVLSRELSNPSEESQEVPFEYDCENGITDGFNVIIYLSPNNTPTGYTEFLNTQGKISNYVWIYLKFKIDINQITLELNNSLYKVRNRLRKESLIGPDLWKFSSSQSIVDAVSKVPKDQKYTSHLSAFLGSHNRSGVYMSDRTLLPSESMITFNLLKDIDIFDGEEYNNFQIGYYKDDIVLYAWTYSDSMYYYKITSLLDQTNYKYTRQEDGEWIDTIGRYDEREVSKDLLYCAGKYLVFKILYQTYSIQALFDTTLDTWLRLESPNPIVDPFDKIAKIIELPKATSIQSYDTALEYMPGLENIYLDLREHIQTERSLEVYKKFGDWYFIRQGDLIIASCMSFSVYMTESEARNCIVLGNNAILIPSDDYYTIYHGVRRKEYYTERARGTSLVDLEVRPGVRIRFSSTQPRQYLDLYRKSEIAIVHKSELVFNSILDSFRHQPLYTYQVPKRIIGGLGNLIFYINQQNNINYL